MMRVLMIAATILSLTQAPVSAPALTELQQVKLEAALLKMEVASYKFLQAERERDAAIDALQRMLAELQRDGYELDVQTMRYRPIPRKDGR